MLLYSTILDIKENLTKDDFIKLVIEWNQSSPHEQNVIKGIQWNGEHNVRFGTEVLWLEIMEYEKENIIAVRYEKVVEDGAVWDTDYIMNFNDMKMAIQLDRSYKEGALNIDPEFTTPHIITMLIEKGYINDDNGLPVLRDSISITNDNVSVLADIINGNAKYKLPIVYVSKTEDNQDPVSIGWLGSKLKGIAHILVEEKNDLKHVIRQVCSDQNEYNGTVGIYYPSSAFGHRSFYSRRWSGEDAALLDKIVRNVMQYWISQNLESLYTWQGVNSALLKDKLNGQKQERIAAETAREMAENELNLYFEKFDEDLDELQRQIEELTSKNEALRYENQGLRAKLNSTGSIPLLFFGNEDDFYEGEIKDIVLSVLDEAARNSVERSRRADILNDIVQNNSYEHLSDGRKDKIKTILKGYKNLSGSMRQDLIDLGFEITDDGKHYKLKYYGDGRYATTMAKTPSDVRGVNNEISQICKTMF